ncbi:MAG TPA: hypothetical protein VKY74_15100 [Chloroflexia bacterium]|nr:hypothetical protein [Chloroflexia bacterium]
MDSSTPPLAPQNLNARLAPAGAGPPPPPPAFAVPAARPDTYRLSPPFWLWYGGFMALSFGLCALLGVVLPAVADKFSTAPDYLVACTNPYQLGASVTMRPGETLQGNCGASDNVSLGTEPSSLFTLNRDGLRFFSHIPQLRAAQAGQGMLIIRCDPTGPVMRPSLLCRSPVVIR